MGDRYFAPFMIGTAIFLFIIAFATIQYNKLLSNCNEKKEDTVVNRCYKSYINLYQSSYFSKYVNKAIYKLGKYNKGLLYVNKIGESVQGVPILSIKIGRGSTKILIQATHHAREAITTILLLDQINYLLNLYEIDYSINNMSIRNLLKYVTYESLFLEYRVCLNT